MLGQFGYIAGNIILFFFISFLGHKVWTSVDIDYSKPTEVLKYWGWIILLWIALGVFALWQKLN